MKKVLVLSVAGQMTGLTVEMQLGQWSVFAKNGFAFCRLIFSSGFSLANKYLFSRKSCILYFVHHRHGLANAFEHDFDALTGGAVELKLSPMPMILCKSDCFTLMLRKSLTRMALTSRAMRP